MVRAALLAMMIAGGASADCRLALVLALDVSSSVDAREDRLQREGLARAMRAPEVVRAFVGGAPVALSVFEWSGGSAQASLLAEDWVVIRRPSDVERAAEAIAGSFRGRDDLGTAVGAALARAEGLFAAGPECRSRTVDVSGDGIGNEGAEPRTVYARGDWDGVTVNALVIGGERAGSQLVAWFAEEVIRGPGAFWMHARGFEDYEEAMRIKLLRELEDAAVGKRGM